MLVHKTYIIVITRYDNTLQPYIQTTLTFICRPIIPIIPISGPELSHTCVNAGPCHSHFHGWCPSPVSHKAIISSVKFPSQQSANINYCLDKFCLIFSLILCFLAMQLSHVLCVSWFLPPSVESKIEYLKDRRQERQERVNQCTIDFWLPFTGQNEKNPN